MERIRWCWLATSMEPPCEHGGVFAAITDSSPGSALQWSRRVNTAECLNAAAAEGAELADFNGAAV